VNRKETQIEKKGPSTTFLLKDINDAESGNLEDAQ
jgi:hypothetical protein